MAEQPFKLENYFFPIVDILASQKHNPKEKNDVLFDVSSSLSRLSRKKPGPPIDYQLNINIQIVEEESENTPYTGGIQVVGLFSTDETLSHEEAASLLVDRGASILYSASREFLLTITGRGPWGSISIPYIHDLSDIPIEEVKELDISKK